MNLIYLPIRQLLKCWLRDLVLHYLKVLLFTVQYTTIVPIAFQKTRPEDGSRRMSRNKYLKYDWKYILIIA